MRELLRFGRLLTPVELLTPAWVQTVDGVITALGAGVPPGRPDRDLGEDSLAVPGLVDMHSHGGGGFDMTAAEPGQVRSALAWSARRGVTASVLSTVSAPIEDLVATIGRAADLLRDQRSDGLTAGSAGGSEPRTRLLGVHLEGPFLSPVRRGAHAEQDLRPPRPAEVARLLSAAPGTVLMLTLAPEIAGSLEAIRAVRDAGAVAALGHTDADAEQTADAVARGARVATHLFNGMRGLHHREPGPAGALLAADGVTCELINDGRHLHPMVVAIASRAAGRGRIALVSDAVAATGAADGRYRLGRVTVESSAGAVRVVAPDGGPRDLPGSLAGGGCGLDESLRRAVQEIGIPLADAVAAVTTTPAAALGVGGFAGSIAVGRAADLCVLDSGLAVRAVCVGGTWLIRGQPEFV